MEAGDVREVTEQVRKKAAFVELLKQEIGKIIVGQRYMVERMLVGLLANGHILVEGVPGLAKTMTVMTLAASVGCKFQRIQFTPDLLPADVIGTLIYNPRSGEFTVRKGPIFANLILADEINRAPAKVQSALLEAMQERQVTIGDQSFRLDEPFLVLATQNPIEQEGTYPLPEAQVDRFMLKLSVTYPTKEEERQIVDRMAATSVDLSVSPVVSPEDILQARKFVDSIYIDDKIKNYILDVVLATRTPADYGLELAQYIRYGASPRASIYLTIASKAYAFIQGRGYVIPQDVKSIAMDILRHRIIISYEAEAEDLTSEGIIGRVLDHIEVP